MMTSMESTAFKVIVVYGFVLGVSSMPVPNPDAGDLLNHVTSTSLEDSTVIPTTAMDGVTLLRRALIGIYEDGVTDLRKRLRSNMRAIDVAIRRGNAVWEDMFGNTPDVEKKGSREPIIIGQGTNLNLQVLTQKLEQLQHEQSMRIAESNAKIFEQYG